MRVYELARELKIPTIEFIQKINQLGIQATNNFSSLTEEQISQIKQQLPELLKQPEKSDLEVLKEIEEEFGVEIEEVDELEIYLNSTISYMVTPNNKITGLSLGEVDSKDFAPIFSKLNTLKNLTNLIVYEIREFDISRLKGQHNLRELEIWNCGTLDFSPIKNLQNLTSLNLYKSQIRSLSPIKNLHNLTTLNLSESQINDLSPIKDLQSLTSLDLSGNQISDLSPLENLRNLASLNLQGNHIKDIDPIKKLKQLKALTLNDNPIERLPNWIVDQNLKLYWDDDAVIYLAPRTEYITFGDNPLKSPPPEIIKEGKEAVKNYFKQLKEEKEDRLYEAKMLIVGEPGAGKTTLARKLQDSDCCLPEENETTKGIEVKPYYFPYKTRYSKKFRLNLWDFGGQEIYKATHRFFLSKLSLYVLVADSRNEDTDFNYWLHTVEMFGGDSPLLIVFNEKYQRKRNVDISAMKKRFSNIVEVIEVDFAEKNTNRLDLIKKEIEHQVAKLPHIGSPIPATWKAIRKDLEKKKKEFITRQDYLKICKKHGLKKPKDALLLSRYFHDIGVFLHFQDDDVLNNTIFLKPNWATNAVYKVLDHELLNQNCGRFKKKEAKIIWSDEEYELIRNELLRLMQRFKLAYRVKKSHQYIVPERLPMTQPDYPWDKRNNLHLRYQYDIFMPKGILAQFIVQSHHHIGNHNLVWSRGVVLEKDGTEAEVIEDHEKRSIQIRISGKNSRDFLTILMEEFDQINGLYEKMKVEKLIPCNCEQCQQSETPHFFNHKNLKKRIEDRKETIECDRSYEPVNVRGLVEAVLDEQLENPYQRGMIMSPQQKTTKPIERTKVFVSYSHKDKEWLERVRENLKVLENEGIDINLWDDTQIKAGMKWRDEIENALAETKVAILLISTQFLASDFICKDELPPLLKAAENDGATILPVILKPCRFAKNKELSVFQAVNDPNRVLTKQSEDEQDEILLALSDRIEELIHGK